MASFFNQATLSYNNNTVNSNIVSGEIVQTVSLTKTSLFDTYSPGSTVTYIVSLINSGDTSLTGLIVSDDLGAYTAAAGTVVPLTYVEGSVKYLIDGVVQPAPAVTSADGVTFSGIGIPASGETVLIYQAQINEFAPLAPGSAITNTAEVAYSIEKAAIASSSFTITFADEAILSIEKAVSPAQVAENGTLTYTFTITNTGSKEADAADNAVVYDTFDPILSDIAVTFDGAPVSLYSYDTLTGEFATGAGLITVPAATYQQDTETGAWSTVPGKAVLTVTGTIGA